MSEKVLYLIPNRDGESYDFYDNAIATYSIGNDEYLSVIGVFAITFLGYSYRICAFDGKEVQYYDLEPMEDESRKMYVVQNNLPCGLSPFMFRVRGTKIKLSSWNNAELYSLEPVDIPHFEKACEQYGFFFVGEHIDPRLNP